MVLYLAIDISGSMMESDKRLISRSVVLAIAQYLRLGYAKTDLRLLAAGASPGLVEWNPDAEYPEALLSCGGSMNLQALTGLVQPTGSKVILITDGSWSVSEKRAFDALLRTQPDGAVRIVKVGSEVGGGLQYYRARGMVFDADQVLEVLDGWLDLPVAASAAEDEW